MADKREAGPIECGGPSYPAMEMGEDRGRKISPYSIFEIIADHRQ